METETWTKPKRFPAQQQQQQLKIVVQEKRRKREGKYRLVFLFFFSLFVFILFGVDERYRGGAGRRTLLEFHCCVCFVAATGHGRGGGTVRAYCVDVWREFSINEKRTARRGAAKAMGAAVLVQHATQRKRTRDFASVKWCHEACARREQGQRGAWVTFQLRFQLPTMRAGRAEEAHTQLGG